MKQRTNTFFKVIRKSLYLFIVPFVLLLSLCPSASDLVTGKSNLSFRVRHAVLFPLYCAAMQLKKKKHMIVIFFIRKLYKGLQGTE